MNTGVNEHAGPVEGAGLAEQQIARAVGSVVVSAFGDALGSQYEEQHNIDPEAVLEFGPGTYGHGIAAWTDDTEMAIPILQAIADGAKGADGLKIADGSTYVARAKGKDAATGREVATGASDEGLLDQKVLSEIVSSWRVWAETAPDVGFQTGTLLSGLDVDSTAADATLLAEQQFVKAGKNGNGSLMRTGPVALGFLKAGAQDQLTQAASAISALTHWGADSREACVIWSHAIRTAILTGQVDLFEMTSFVPVDRRDFWNNLIVEALELGDTPQTFATKNGWVIAAFQGAVNAVMTTGNAWDAINKAIKGGGDTDTVAAIAGSLAGAIHGADSIPADMLEQVHGYPDLNIKDLEALTLRAIR